ncbi:hypothetical protein [Neorhizobium sp. JUb45]|uniref:hypothetical protein n=1 Tax=Neorhizobium sp. JUb45 TaxID=2485113 RepID=UPI0010441CE7|nr:hypothetical protein [Neorhizobium sp. JUb45]TCR07240.1 hypothetical protein EDF70_1011211 [Neorhizobium sp. JUb45]
MQKPTRTAEELQRMIVDRYAADWDCPELTVCALRSGGWGIAIGHHQNSISLLRQVEEVARPLKDEFDLAPPPTH